MPELSPTLARRLLRWSLAFIWLYTALVSAVLSPTEGLRLLEGAGITGALAAPLMYGTSLLEVLLGLAVLSGRYTRPLALFQAALIVGFTAIITLSPGLRGLWLHPFGPISKNVPLLGALAVLYAAGDER
jgi:hypothetical protein